MVAESPELTKERAGMEERTTPDVNLDIEQSAN
jgi:hypothetical protein